MRTKYNEVMTPPQPYKGGVREKADHRQDKARNP